MKMKKLIPTALAALMILASAAACSTNSKDVTEEMNVISETEAETADLSEEGQETGDGRPDAPPDNGGEHGAPPDGDVEHGEPGGTPPDGNGGGFGGGSSSSDIDYTASVIIDSEDTQSNKTYTSVTADESAILISTADSVTIGNPTVTKTGDSDGGDNCNFYGLNAAVLLLKGEEHESNTLITMNTWIDAENVADYE